MENGKYRESAERTVEALRKMLSNEEATSNFESYLSYHYAEWLKMFAHSPETMTSELEDFATIEF